MGQTFLGIECMPIQPTRYEFKVTLSFASGVSAADEVAAITSLLSGGRLLSSRSRWRVRCRVALNQRLCYTATQTGSYQKAALLASCWGTTISDDLIHGQVQSVGLQVHQQVMPAPTGAPKNEAPFSLVIMLDGWMVRERGPQWAAPPDCKDAERVAWHEVKSGVIYRLNHRAETASGRGVLTQKKVVACPPGTDVLEFGATVQKEALRCGMARAQEVFVVVDGPSG